MFIIIFIGVFLLLLLCLTGVGIKRYTFMKRVFEYYNPDDFSADQQKEMYKHFKNALEYLDIIYTTYFDYISKDHQNIFKCKCLIKDKIASNLYDDYESDLSDYEGTNIREEAVEKINECIGKLYVLESAIEYFEHHINMATKTINLLTTEQQDSDILRRYYHQLVMKRITYLKNIIIQCENIIEHLEQRQNDFKNAIKELERIKKPTLLGVAVNILTAPIRHTFNIVDSLITGDEQKFVRSTSMIGLTFLGAGIISEAIDAIDAVDLTSIDSLDTDIHQVESHYVDSYAREDGTVVSGYERGGESGYLRSNPDETISNNLRS
jgi:hypothetical protein